MAKVCVTFKPMQRRHYIVCTQLCTGFLGKILTFVDGRNRVTRADLADS